MIGQLVKNIAYESGFMNVSNLNRQFKFIIGKTPQEYRKLFTNYD
jgi:AraC-like DNA-binding protein